MLIKVMKKIACKLYLKNKYDVRLCKGTNVNRVCRFEGNNTLYNNTTFLSSYLGLFSYVASDCNIKFTRIGRFCSIGSNVRIFLGKHPSRDFVSTHPAFYSKIKVVGETFAQNQLFDEHEYIGDEKRYVVDIGNDVWIGNNVSIMDGVKVGDGAIIGMGSIVTKDIEPYSINVGIPCRKIRYRFEHEEIEKLLKDKWWTKSINELRSMPEYFKNIKHYTKMIG